MPQPIRIGIVGGTGLGEALLAGVDASALRVEHVETPFGAPSGPLNMGEIGGVPVAVLQRHGEGHLLNPTSVPYRANVYALKAAGCTHVIASGATGSLRETIHPGELVLCDQLIDRTIRGPRTFFEHAAVHVEFADPCCPVMRRWLGAAAERVDATVHEQGTYVCIEGPSFSTRAESSLHREMGADVVGMTALPEARLVREAEMAYALVALPTDYDCWRSRDDDERSEASLLSEIMANLQRASVASIALIKAALADVSLLNEPSPAHDALSLAIWSDRSRIAKAEVERLRVLWGGNFRS